MTSLLGLPWLPEDFADQVLVLMNPPMSGYDGYLAQVEVLRGLFRAVIHRLVADGDYGDDAISEAFIRSHEEPGRAWNMDEWNMKHQKRTA